MGHFARECHSARICKFKFIEKTEEGAGEAGLALRIRIVPKRAKEDITATAATEGEVVHQRERKVERY